MKVRITQLLVLVLVLSGFGQDFALTQESAGGTGQNTEAGPDSSIIPGIIKKDAVLKGEGSLDLKTCYVMALKKSETIAITEEEIRITEARFLQALSTVIPHVSFISMDNKEQEKAVSSTSSSLSSLSPSTSSVRKFNVTQTLFNGFKTIAAVKGARSEHNQRLQDTIKAKQLLLIDVANSFYLLVELRMDLNALEKIRQAYVERITELRQREKLGRSRSSEVVNAKAQLYRVTADIELVMSQEDVARQLLEYLIGSEVVNIADEFETPLLLKDRGYYLAKSPQRPEIKAAKYAWNLAKQEVLVRGSDYLPSVDLEANYYTQRTGFNKDIDWDVSLTVDMPIFEGTETLGLVKEAESRARQRELEYRRASRWAPYDIQDAYVRLRTAINIQQSLKDAYETSRLNYHMQKKDYELNLVNNLDVLAAISGLQDSQRNYIHAYYEAKRLYWQLKVAVGEGLDEDMNDAI